MDSAIELLLKEGFGRAALSPSVSEDLRKLFAHLANKPDDLFYHKRSVGIPLPYDTKENTGRFVAALEAKYPSRVVN